MDAEGSEKLPDGVISAPVADICCGKPHHIQMEPSEIFWLRGVDNAVKTEVHSVKNTIIRGRISER